MKKGILLFVEALFQEMKSVVATIQEQNLMVSNLFVLSATGFHLSHLILFGDINKNGALNNF